MVEKNSPDENRGSARSVTKIRSNLNARIEAGAFVHMLDESSMQDEGKINHMYDKLRNQNYPQVGLNEIDDKYIPSAHKRETLTFKSNISENESAGNSEFFKCDVSELNL